MKLLFTDGKGEPRELLGFLDADIEINKIKSQLFTATREIISIIGQPAYDYFYSLYAKPQVEGEETPLTEDEAYLLYNARYAIMLDAVRHYAPSGDVNFTTNGRKMRNENNQTAAWEWMINRSDEALEKDYYRAVDALLAVLDELDPTVKTEGEVKWKATDAYLESHRLYVRSTSDFDQYFPINSRLLLLKLQPGLSQCERLHIVPRIGKTRDAALKTALKSNSEEGLDKDLLELIKEACVFFALAWAVRRLRVSLLPEGILQRYSGERVNSKNTKVPEKMEAELTAQSFEGDAEKVLQAIESHIKALNTIDEPATEFTTDPNFEFDDDDNFVST
ncbi:DUF6712 family protein [Salinimicrobium sp. WS361]|uniref:DUF6712 family protein n=1 Tax=Salinimicrobium sp. WS361 TaxID=3425123 RepID=UPI003D6FFA12